jgi:hypothetical protein
MEMTIRLSPPPPHAGRSCRGWPASPDAEAPAYSRSPRRTSLHEDAAGPLDELDLDLAAVAHPVFDCLLRSDAGVSALEGEALAAVFRFHAGLELAAFAQIDGASGRVPVVLGGIPLLDVGRAVR